ncbi:MAG TPA: O-methyltransferase [Sphingomonas sp.]|jgi:hypothetical protein|uniref:O-methyltransferase n=1 Tax=Sphingomonas sp. TaxID=28214 RepID=UPI002ED84465
MSDASFNGVNYSLRPSKTIQRGLIFEGLRQLQDQLDWSRASYVGFGSIWFTDFLLAHKILRISRMVSIESNDVGYRRAVFNKPYRFIRMKQGVSSDVIPALYDEARFPTHPSIMWLDYDEGLDEDKLDELRFNVENAAPNSVLLVTLNAGERHYGADDSQRLERVKTLFGRLAPDTLRRRSVRGFGLAQTLAGLVQDAMVSTSTKIRKVNSCVPAFNISYRDKATMITVGAIFPSQELRAFVRSTVRSPRWPGFVDDPIIAPHLTLLEAAVLQANLPRRPGLNRDAVQELGFDLEDEQIRAFETFYRHYPVYAQIVS